MADYRYVPINKELVPYKFDIAIGGRTFTLEVRYNATHDFFTLDLYRDETLIVAGEKIVYGRILFLNQQHLDVPRTAIIPYDLSLNEIRATWGNLSETVFLWLPGGLEDAGLLD